MVSTAISRLVKRGCVNIAEDIGRTAREKRGHPSRSVHWNHFVFPPATGKALPKRSGRRPVGPHGRARAADRGPGRFRLALDSGVTGKYLYECYRSVPFGLRPPEERDPCPMPKPLRPACSKRHIAPLGGRSSSLRIDWANL